MMGNNNRRLAAALLCAGFLGVLAAGETQATDVRGSSPALVPGAGNGALQAALNEEEVRMRAERANFGRFFANAYAHYPRIPRGTLEAIAYTQSRWDNLNPDARGANTGHQDMPRAWGLMGLYHGEGFADQVALAADLLQRPAGEVMTDPAVNVLAAAALLDRELPASPVDEIATIADALERYAGFPAEQGSVLSYARASFAFDVLLALDRGVNDRGIVVPERAVKWELAFEPDMLVKLDAPFLRLDVQGDTIETAGYRVDPITEQLERNSAPAENTSSNNSDGGIGVLSTDYAPAIWLASPNYSSRGGSAVREAVIHTTEGTYAGAISWLRNPASQASAHYVVRSSDGQITQLVRESDKAWHARSHNPYSLGIEHEAFVGNSSWYTAAMYNASSGIVRMFCARYAGITCSSAYKGASSSGHMVLDDSVDIKGHQHLSDNDHNDPGIYWNWARYYDLINPGSAGGTGTKILDTFESTVGHFVTSPTYSGSTVGVATTSSAVRDCSIRKLGSCSLRVELIDNTASSAAWAVRLLSGSGTPGSNVQLARNGRVGFWVFAAGTGMQVGVGIDDSDGTERSVSRSLPANTWTYVEWSLSDAAQWSAWAGSSNGAITASNVTLDAIWLYHANTAYTVNTYIDDVQIRY
jgi:N-acetyl-anhydromuramyl-L-alanine amidase AmpD